MLSIDFYVWQGVKFLIHGVSAKAKQVITYTYWGYTIFTFLFFASMPFTDVRHSSTIFRITLSLIFAILILKVIWFVFIFMDDIIRAIRATGTEGNPFKAGNINPTIGTKIAGKKEVVIVRIKLIIINYH